VPSSVIPADTKDLVVKRHPGVITLTKQKPVFNAGKITLEIPKK
jgi:hypothetical protein